MTIPRLLATVARHIGKILEPLAGPQPKSRPFVVRNLAMVGGGGAFGPLSGICLMSGTSDPRGSQDSLTPEQVDVFPYKVRKRDLPTLAGDPDGSVKGGLGGFAIKVTQMKTEGERARSLASLIPQVQMDIAEIESETEVFEFLLTILQRAKFSKMLFYKVYRKNEKLVVGRGSALEGQVHCVLGEGIDPRSTGCSLNSPPQFPNAEEPLRELLAEAQAQNRENRTLLYKIEDPACDPRYAANFVRKNPLYAGTHILVPLIDFKSGNVGGLLEVWAPVEEEIPFVFDNSTCGLLITIAGTVGARLGELVRAKIQA